MERTADILCIGALHLDLVAMARGRLLRGADEPGHVRRSAGGVAFNIARALAQHGLRPRLVAAVGHGSAMLAEAVSAAGIEPDLLHVDAPGDLYLAIEDKDGLVAAIAEARLPETEGPALVKRIAGWRGALVVDSNLSPEALALLAAGHRGNDLRLASAGSGRAHRLRAFLGLPGAAFYLNRAEAEALLERPLPSAAEAAHALAAAGAARAIITDGPRPAAEAEGAALRHVTPPAVEALRVTGAGDTFMAAHLAAERAGATRDDALAAAVSAAARHVAAPVTPAA